MKYLVTLSVLLLGVPAFAQITITESDYLATFSQSSTGKTSYSADTAKSLQAMIADSGANQTWNFNSIAFTKAAQSAITDTIVPYPGGAALADSFPQATHVMITTAAGGVVTSRFVIFNASGYYEVGSSQTQATVNSVIQRYSPPMMVIPFPMTAGTTWTAGPSTVTSLTTSTLVTLTGSIDAWGSLTLPGQSAIQCLRAKLNYVETAKATGKVTKLHEFTWGSTAKPTVIIVSDSNQIALGGSYAIPNAPNTSVESRTVDPFSIRLGANPLNAPSNLYFTMPSDASVRVSLMDGLGRQPQILQDGFAHAGVNMLPLDPAQLPNGLYFLRVESGEKSAEEKVVVAR